MYTKVKYTTFLYSNYYYPNQLEIPNQYKSLPVSFSSGESKKKMEDIFTAAKENNIKTLQNYLLGKDGNVNEILMDSIGDGRKPAVTFAIENNHTETVEWFLDRGCRIGKNLDSHGKKLLWTRLLRLKVGFYAINL